MPTVDISGAQVVWLFNVQVPVMMMPGIPMHVFKYCKFEASQII